MASAEAVADMLRVEVVYCTAPGACDLVTLALPAGTCLADALQASGLLDRHGLLAEGLHVGVWGKSQPPAHVLRDRDRVEVYRPLTVDPKEARRLRYREHLGSTSKPAGRQRG